MEYRDANLTFNGSSVGGLIEIFRGEINQSKDKHDMHVVCNVCFIFFDDV